MSTQANENSMSNADKVNQQLLSRLLDKERETLEGKAFFQRETEITREGHQIILPAKPVPMAEATAIKVLQDKIKMQQETVEIHETVECYPIEGAYILMKVLRAKYGWAKPIKSKPENPFEEPKPPTMVNFDISATESVQVIWGTFEIPGLDARLETSATKKNGRFVFCLTGECKLKDKQEIAIIAAAVRTYVKKHSVYKGQAIRITTADGKIKYMSPPTFMDLSKVDENELVFSDQVQTEIQTSLFTPVEKTALCEKYNVPLKRGVLLEGPYGVGKTLTALVQAKKCVENGWTYIYLDRVDALKDAMLFARAYSPAVIFAEDIDRVLKDRDVSVDDILNHIDGIDSKSQQLMVVLTTNFVERIDKAMLRPGRLDAVITVSPPDARAAEKLMRIYSRGLIADDEDLTFAGKELANQIPAVIREVVERSKLYAMGQINGDEDLKLTGKSLTQAARGMKNHIALIQEKKETETEAEKLHSSMSCMVKSAFNGTAEKIQEIHENLI